MSQCTGAAAGSLSLSRATVPLLGRSIILLCSFYDAVRLPWQVKNLSFVSRLSLQWSWSRERPDRRCYHLHRVASRDGGLAHVSIDASVELVLWATPRVLAQVKQPFRRILESMSVRGRCAGMLELANRLLSGSAILPGVIMLRYLLKAAPRVTTDVGDKQAGCQRAGCRLPPIQAALTLDAVLARKVFG